MLKSTIPKTYFPILISISNRPCLIIGGGPIARHKVESLLKFSPDITIIAPDVDEKLAEIAGENNYKILKKQYQASDLNGFELVIAATGKKDLSKQIWQDCKERKIKINTFDDHQYCDFILPATVKRGALTVSVGTQGKSPFLTKEIRRWMNRMFPPEWGEVVEIAADFRKQVLTRYSLKEKEKRAACFARFLEIDWAAQLKEKKPEELKHLISSVLEGKNLSSGE